MSTREIALALGVSQRYVFTLLKLAEEYEVGTPQSAIHYKKLPQAVKDCLEPTPEGFKKFYERYSGYPLPAHAYDWVKQALNHERVLINCPPRHAKSKIFSVWIPIWLIARDRDVQILVCSSTVHMAQKFTREVASHLEKNSQMIQELGRFVPVDEGSTWRPNKGELIVEGRQRLVLPGDMTIQARGAQQAILGMEADWIFVDDVVSNDSARSETEREKLSDWFHGEVLTRMNNTGRVVVVGQRLNLGDLYGELAEKVMAGTEDKLWHHINYPAVIQWPDPDAKPPVEAKVLWPEEWPFEKLMQRRADITRKGSNSLWECMFQQNPLADEQVLVPREWIFGDPGCLDRNRRLGTGIGEDQRRCRVVSLDPSPTKWAGLICADIRSLDSGGRQMEISILDVVRDRMGVREMIQNISDMHQRYGIDYLIVETNSARFFLQGQDFQNWSQTSGVRLIGHNTSRNKQDPEWGVLSLASDFEFGRIRLPYDGPDAMRVMEPLIHEVTTYPYAETDDVLMALWFIKYNWRRLPPVIRETPKVGGSRKGFHIPERLAAGFGWARD